MHPHRRRKKRPNYGVRTVDVGRGENGFGFTISGQQPCILSCIVADSPADAAGLRAGDFLISVNGANVSKLPHDAVVQAIGSSSGVIKMSIAENYFSDSSDDDTPHARGRQRPKHPHNRSRPHRAGRPANCGPPPSKGAGRPFSSTEFGRAESAAKTAVSHSVILNANISNTNDINNVSAMVNPGVEQVRAIKVVRDLKTGAMFEEASENSADTENVSQSLPAILNEDSVHKDHHRQINSLENNLEPLSKIIEKQSSLECRAIVGYLGTIEMPKQIATSSKLQTVRSCIRKMRQEKRSPCTVLMTILPSVMTLRNASGELLAEYAAKRINYVSCSSENDYRFFGLVTSTSYPMELNDYEALRKKNGPQDCDIAISNSCHVFMIDTQTVNHQNHIMKAETFKIKCTPDPITGMCLEFPNNSEYIVNIIRIIYSLKPPNGFSGKGNIENISRLSNMDRSGRSPRGSNFVRKINRPKLSNRCNNMNLNIHIEQNEPYQNEAHNLPREVLNRQGSDVGQANPNEAVANSPQPSNHSEITTTSSNSDSGIGFHNDCQNISDRILVVDFPNPIHNNFNAPGPAFNPREGNCLPLRENNRPMGVVGIDPDVDRQFLSNTTPVVEGFGGQGRPLNHMESIMLENMPNQIVSRNIYLAKHSTGETSGMSRSKCSDRNICSKNNQCGYSISDVQKHMKNKLTVRAMPETSSNKQQTFHSSIDHSCMNDSPHYDPVYSDEPACYEEHHYEIIYPDENNMHNENICNSKKCYTKNPKYNWIEPSQSVIVQDIYYSERAVDVPCDRRDCYENDNANKRTSLSNCSYDNMSMISSKSHEINETKLTNFSNDDVSIYSSKSHDEIITSSKFKSKSRKLQTSADDILILGTKKSKTKDSPDTTTDSKRNKDGHVFLHPANVKMKSKKIKKPSIFPSKSSSKNSDDSEKKHSKKKGSHKPDDAREAIQNYKLSPKVYNVSRASVSVEDICKSSGYSQTKNNWRHLEGTTSEPDLRDCQTNDYYQSESGSPFGRWAGSGSGRLLTHRSYRRPGSLVSSEHDMYTKCETDEKSAAAEKQQQQAGGVASWAISLERLLSEPAGVHSLAVFLEREFSAENIRFWTACERWSRAPASARPAMAAAVHARHLADGSSDPVNVDASARQLAGERLHLAPPDLFVQAQKQIFNLMKFDSYPRFIKSDIYKECLLAELQGRPPPYPGDPSLTIDTRESSPVTSPTKLKKSLSNAEDKRRKSLLPWHRRLRSKSRDRCFEDDEDEEAKNTKTDDRDHDPKGSNSSLLTGWDVTRGLNHKQCSTSSSCSGSACSCSGNTIGLCRVVVPGLSATSVVVASGGEETVRQLLDRLLEKRAVKFQSYEVYGPDSNKPIDINESSSVLAGKEVTVEQRVIFKLDLPNRKVVSVKAKPNKALGDVLKPVLHKYSVGSFDGLCLMHENKLLDLNLPVQAVDNQRLQVVIRTTPIQQADVSISHKAMNSQTNGGVATVPSLDEITNRVFEELLQGKADKHSGNIEEESIRSDNCSSENSSGIFGRFMRRDDHRSKGVKIKKQQPAAFPSNQAFVKSIPQTASSEGSSSCCMDEGNFNGGQKPLITKLRAGVKIQNAVGIPGSLDNTEFLENLKQMQRARLKSTTPSNINAAVDQRGKENLKNDSQYYGDKSSSQSATAKLIPVAAARVIPTAASLSANTPCPAPRLSLVNAEKAILNHIQSKSEGNSARTSTESTDIEAMKKSSEYSPQKSAFNSLDNTVIENFHPDSSADIPKVARQLSNPEKGGGGTYSQSNLAQDFLNGSTTSGSDHFVRSCDILNSSFHSSGSSCENENCRRVSDPPPLPPKPKVLPIKPPNWGHTLSTVDDIINMRMQDVNLPDVNSNGIADRNKRAAYLDQPSSSFV